MSTKKTKLKREIACHREQMRTLLDAKFKRQKCIIKLQKQVDIDTSTIVFYQNLALKGEIRLFFLKKKKRRRSKTEENPKAGISIPNIVLKRRLSFRTSSYRFFLLVVYYYGPA